MERIVFLSVCLLIFLLSICGAALATSHDGLQTCRWSQFKVLRHAEGFVLKGTLSQASDIEVLCGNSTIALIDDSRRFSLPLDLSECSVGSELWAVAQPSGAVSDNASASHSTSQRGYLAESKHILVPKPSHDSQRWRRDSVGVPEFSSYSLLITVAFATMGLFLLRRNGGEQA